MSEKSQGVILILHGWRVPVERYFPLKKLFEEKGFKVLIPQLPGFSTEETVEKVYALDDYVKFVVNFAKKEGIENFFLVGHSFGGRVALKLAVTHSGKIKALVLTGVPAIRNRSGKRLGFLILAKIGKALCATPPFCLFQNLFKKILYYLTGEWDYYKTKGDMRQTFKNIVSEDLSPLISKIKTPTLLIWGENDKIVPVSVAQRIVAKIPGSKLSVVSTISHKLPYEEPEIFAKKCLRFCSKIL